MKVIIPMAGHSRRFREAGYLVPKPFIMIDGRPMIERICQMFSPTDEFIFICNREHLEEPSYRRILNNIVRFYHVVEIEPHELGPLYSALAAEEFVKDDEPVIITYCDFTMSWNYRHFLLKAAMYDGAIPVFRGFHPASFGDAYYCYIRANESQEMLGLQEKKPFTDNRSEEFASTGVYYVASWKVFKHYARKIMEENQRVASEYYVSLIYNPMVLDGKSICVYEVKKFICWGTPEDLQEYLFWVEYFNLVQSKKGRTSVD